MGWQRVSNAEGIYDPQPVEGLLQRNTTNYDCQIHYTKYREKEETRNTFKKKTADKEKLGIESYYAVRFLAQRSALVST